MDAINNSDKLNTYEDLYLTEEEPETKLLQGIHYHQNIFNNHQWPHQLFAAGIQATDIYPELWIYFYQELSNVTWIEFLTKKFIWVMDNYPIKQRKHSSWYW